MNGYDGYRSATAKDLSLIYGYLREGKKEEVLVHSLCYSREPYPLLDICRGPFSEAEEGIDGFSPEGERQSLRLVPDGPRHYIELRNGDGIWKPRELGSAILLLRA